MKSHIRNLYNLLFSIISHGCGKSKFVLMINLDNCDSWLKVGISRKNYLETCCRHTQGGITCGAIEDPRKSSKAIDERVIINFRDKNGVIARFRDKNVYR